MNWSLYDVEKLIKLVKENPCLYDRNGSLYTNRPHSERIWKEIAKALHYDVVKVKKKWKYLRDQFVGEHHKNKYRRKASKWVNFDSMSFLIDHINPMHADVRTGDSGGDTSTKLNSDEEYGKIDRVNQDSTVTIESSDEDTDNSRLRSRKRRKSAIASPAKKKNSGGEVEASVTRTLQTGPAIVPTMIPIAHPFYEEHLYFFNSLLPHICRIPAQLQLAFRSKIQEVVAQFAYQVSHDPNNYILATALQPEDPLQTNLSRPPSPQFQVESTTTHYITP